MVKIGNRPIGDAHPCYITFEIGPTHNGLESAKRLIKYAAESGADAVKFQILDPDRLVADRKQLFSYHVLKNRETEELELVQESLYEILKRRALSVSEWCELKKYTDSLGLAFFSTVGFEEEVELLEKIGCDSIKIASADVNHFPLIRRAARTGMCLQLDTGMASIGEIEAAVDVILSEGNENIIIHQCPSGYPARLESINLKIIPTLKKLFPYPIAFSDHTPGHDMDIAAVALGANLVEKTITEDRMTRSVEHVMSLEPYQMKAFVQTIRDLEIALGNGRRILHSEEKTKRNAIRRSAFIRSPVKAGTLLKDCDIDFRRPGYGLTPDQYEIFIDTVIKIDCEPGHMIKVGDLA